MSSQELLGISRNWGRNGRKNHFLFFKIFSISRTISGQISRANLLALCQEQIFQKEEEEIEAEEKEAARPQNNNDDDNDDDEQRDQSTYGHVTLWN